MIVALLLAAVDFQTSQTGALVHHSLCIARVIQCQSEAYEKLWLGDSKDKDDERALEALRTVDATLRRKRFGPDPLAEQSAFPLPARDYDGHQRLRKEAFAARDLSALQAELLMWMTKDDVDKAMAALRRFEPRFAKHWAKAGPMLGERRKALAVWQAELDRFAADVHRYLQSDLPEAFTVYLVDRPSGSREGHAERVADVALVEAAAEDASFDVARAAMVQLVKAFYAGAPLKTHKDRQRALSSIESDSLLAAYTLLDEVLAYGLTGPVLAKRLQQKSKSRASAVLERLVTKLAPLLEAQLEVKPLDGRTSAEVVEAIIAAEPKELATPRMALRYCEVAFNRPLTDARRELTRALGAEQVTGYSPFDVPEVVDKMKKRHTSYMSVVWLVKPTEIARLAKHSDFFDAKVLADLERQTAPFAFGVRRPVPNPAYVFVATTTEQFRALFQRFAARPKAFIGLMP